MKMKRLKSSIIAAALVAAAVMPFSASAGTYDMTLGYDAENKPELLLHTDAAEGSIYAYRLRLEFINEIIYTAERITLVADGAAHIPQSEMDAALVTSGAYHYGRNFFGLYVDYYEGGKWRTAYCLTITPGDTFATTWIGWTGATYAQEPFYNTPPSFTEIRVNEKSVVLNIEQPQEGVYVLEYSNDLKTWYAVNGTVSGPACYFRVRRISYLISGPNSYGVTPIW